MYKLDNSVLFLNRDLKTKTWLIPFCNIMVLIYFIVSVALPIILTYYE